MSSKAIALAVFLLIITQGYASEAEGKAAESVGHEGATGVEQAEHELPYIFPGVEAVLGAIGMAYFAAIIMTLPKFLAEEKEGVH